MNYSSIFVFLVSLLSSSNVYSMRYNDPLNNMYNNQPYGNSNQEVVNIGNGVNRRNFVILEDNSNYPNTRGQPDQTGYRYGGSSSVNNIGNGVNNHNTVVLDGGSDGGRQYESWNNGGTTVVRNRNNGKDIFNVGYGQGNQNRVSIDGRPVQTGRPRQTSVLEEQMKILNDMSADLQRISYILNQIEEAEKRY
ncbi:putative uncharacterized protein DDB_G0287457 isoform X2 [Bicyclus anynana]|uniref:Uncharacterized protein n=1 Tax=Bicyclus anynana TaxID=110368 RepID=A0A6J1P3P9_BICAN|nr:putative uncharacterized protein DDB_G0287457 isoform X2 [Bicyclus anynana]